MALILGATKADEARCPHFPGHWRPGSLPLSSCTRYARNMNVTVAAIEDHEATALGITHAVSNSADLEFQAVFPTVTDYERSGWPYADVVLLDLRLGDDSDPFANAHRLISRGAHVLIYSSLESPYLIRRALQAGVHGVIEKSRPIAELTEAVRTVAAGEVYATADWAAAIDADGDFPHTKLSARQRDVLELYASGESAKRVARLLDLSPETVQDYLERIRTKYAVSGRPANTKIELFRRAQEDGLLPGPDDPHAWS